MPLPKHEPIISRPNHGCRRYEGKTAIVTGGTLGIGRAIVERLAEEGATVLFCSRKAKNVTEAEQEMRKRGLNNVHGMTCNVSKTEDQQAVVERAVQLGGGKVDVVVANAAVNPFAGSVFDISSEAFDKIMNVNVKSYWELVKLCRPYFGPKSSVLFVSSIGGYNPQNPLGIYSVSKTALFALAKVLAQEIGNDGHRINVLAPGLIRTKFSRMLWDGSHGETKADAVWLGRLGEPEEMAGVAAFLCSEDAAYITGETVTAAGGEHSRL